MGPLGGFIDELSIYYRALKPSEIKAIFDAGSAGKIMRQPNPRDYADQVLKYEPLITPLNNINADPSRSLGPPDTRYVSLGGNGGTLEVAFTDNALLNGDGVDLRVLEFGGPEPYDVYVLVNGSFVFLGTGRWPANFDLGSVGIAGPVTTVSIFDRGGSSEKPPGADIDAVVALNSAPLP